MNAAVATWNFSGTVLVTRKGRIVYQNAKGLAVRESRIPNSINTKFRIGSVTKQFVAAIVLQLQEKGLLNVADTLGKFFPDFPRGNSITIHQLLTHTSGVTNYTKPDKIEPGSLLGVPRSVDSLYKLLTNQPLDFAPGEKYSYSNGGYLLLGLIIEKITAKKFELVLTENILKPAGMLNSGFERSNDVISNRAFGYRYKEGQWKNFHYHQVDWAFTAGAMYSTVEDLHNWNTALLEGKILTKASRTKMWSGHATTGKNAGYGYGVEVDSYKNRPRIGHGGELVPFLSYSQYFLQEDAYLIVLANTDNVGAYRIGCDLAALLFDQPNQTPHIYKEKKLTPEQLQKFVCSLKIDGRAMRIILKDVKLFRVFDDNPTNLLQLVPESASLLFYSDRDAQWEFVRNKEGRLVKVIYWFDGEKAQEITEVESK